MSTIHDALFDRAVRMIRAGQTSLSIEEEFDAELPGLSILEIRQIISRAGAWASELQNKAFSAAVEAFQRGESRIEVERKLRELGFHSWDAQIVAGRAQAKAAAEEK